MIHRDAEAAGQHIKAATHRSLERIGALRDDPDRRMRRLQRLRKHHGVGYLEVLAVVAERLALERSENDVERFVPAIFGLFKFEAEALEFIILIPAAEADIEPPAAEQIERGDFFGDHQRVMQRHHDHRSTHAQRFGFRRDVRGELRGARQIAVGRKVMLAQPHVAKAERFGGLRLLDTARVNFLRRTRGR